MPSFWSYISNGEYSVGCTGRTVYVYDKNGVELAKFKDLPYDSNIERLEISLAELWEKNYLEII